VHADGLWNFHEHRGAKPMNSMDFRYLHASRADRSGHKKAGADRIRSSFVVTSLSPSMPYTIKPPRSSPHPAKSP
jgi:hypothetical protein